MTTKDAYMESARTLDAMVAAKWKATDEGNNGEAERLASAIDARIDEHRRLYLAYQAERGKGVFL